MWSEHRSQDTSLQYWLTSRAHVPLLVVVHQCHVHVDRYDGWKCCTLQGPDQESLCVVDPELSEEAAQQGSATFIVNTAKEVCGTHKADGIGLTIAETMR